MSKIKELINKVPKWLRRIILGLVVASLIIHVVLPPVIKKIINGKLNSIEGYYGYIEDIDISLVRGAYQIEGIHLYSDELDKHFPLLEMKRIDISIQWFALFSGSLVAKVDFIEPDINLVVASEPEQSRKTNNFKAIKLTVFRDVLTTQIPLNINKMHVVRGRIHYIDKSSIPNVDIQLTEVDFKITNLSNSLNLSKSLISDFDFSSIAMNSAALKFQGSFDPFDEDISLNLDFELKNLDLTKLNKMFLAYAKFDIEKGDFSIYSEVEIEKGQLDGYMKPIIKGLKIVNFKEEKKNIRNMFWQALIGGSSKLIMNRNQKEIASKIPLKGTITDPKYGVLTMLGNIFYHSFFHAVKPEVDDKFNFRDKK